MWRFFFLHFHSLSKHVGPVPDMEEIREQLKPILLLPEQGLNDVRHSLKELLRTENSILLNSLNIMVSFDFIFDALIVSMIYILLPIKTE